MGSPLPWAPPQLCNLYPPSGAPAQDITSEGRTSHTVAGELEAESVLTSEANHNRCLLDNLDFLALFPSLSSP